MYKRQVYRNPDFLFFDEATNSLDANNEKAIVERLSMFYKGKTVVVIAHRLSTVMGADQIIVLDQGIKAKKLSGDLLHYSYDSISSHIEQTNKFTTIAAKAAYAQGIKSNWFKIITRPPLKFLRDYFYKLGILDGKYGLIICVINSLSAFLKYSKIKELQEGKNI